jgi:hypothetical protein
MQGLQPNREHDHNRDNDNCSERQPTVHAELEAAPSEENRIRGGNLLRRHCHTHTFSLQEKTLCATEPRAIDSGLATFGGAPE